MLKKLNFFFLLIPLSVIICIGCGQSEKLKYNPPNEDSICQYGKKYSRPDRITIDFPSTSVSNQFKIREIHKAIPESLNNENNKGWWLYNYFFVDELKDYDPKSDSTFTPKQDNFIYKLKDTYFLDINGDGRLDFIHYPKYYMAIMRDKDLYEIFIQNPDGYKWISFEGYIIDITFNEDKTLNSLNTYQPNCCDDNHHFFYWYTFDKSTNDLILTKTDTILTCQLLRDR